MNWMARIITVPKKIPKLGNSLEKLDWRSDSFSYTFIPNTDIPYTLPTNFIDSEGKNPNPQDKISPRNIVFQKENLADNNWLFTLEEHKVVAEKSFKGIKWVVIRSKKTITKMIEKVAREKQKLIQKREAEEDHWNININFAQIDPATVTEKISTLDDFQKTHPEYNGEMLGKFQTGDEIWHCNQKVNDRDGSNECFLLVRNTTIIYSPFISKDLGNGWRTRPVIPRDLLADHFVYYYGGGGRTKYIKTPNFYKSSSFINSSGEHPEPRTIIRYNKIVFTKEELADNKWLYVGNESVDEIKSQFKTLRHLRLCFDVEEDNPSKNTIE